MTRMEALSLRPDHGPAGLRPPSDGSEPPTAPEFGHGIRYPAPRPPPVDVVIPPAAPSPQEDHVLKVVQQPEIAKVAAPKEKVRTPLDPPLVVELSFRSQESNRCAAPTAYHHQPTHADRTYLSSPFFFGNVELIPERQPRPTERRQFQSAMIGGSLVSSLHKVRLEDGLDHAFFVFGDLNIKVVGQFQLRFTLFEMHKRDSGEFHVVQLGSILTNTFKAYASKDFPGQMESTPLSKLLCDQGIKLRIRKETSKRKAHSSDWAADHYLNAHAPLLSYPRGSFDPFHTGYGRSDQWNGRRRYSPPYPLGSAAAGPTRHLPGIATLPPGPTLPNPSAPSTHPAGSVLAPAAVLPLEASLPPVMRAPFPAPSGPEHHHPRAWPLSSPFGDKSAYGGGRDQSTHECGSPSGLEHYQHMAPAARCAPGEPFPPEMPSALSHDDRYGRRPSISAAAYDHPQAYSAHDFRPHSALPDFSRSRTAAPRALLPPIVPGRYPNGTPMESALSPPFQPAATGDERAVQPRPPPPRLDGPTADPHPRPASRRPGPPG